MNLTKSVYCLYFGEIVIVLDMALILRMSTQNLSQPSAKTIGDDYGLQILLASNNSSKAFSKGCLFNVE